MKIRIGEQIVKKYDQIFDFVVQQGVDKNEPKGEFRLEQVRYLKLLEGDYSHEDGTVGV